MTFFVAVDILGVCQFIFLKKTWLIFEGGGRVLGGVVFLFPQFR